MKATHLRLLAWAASHALHDEAELDRMREHGLRACTSTDCAHARARAPSAHMHSRARVHKQTDRWSARVSSFTQRTRGFVLTVAHSAKRLLARAQCSSTKAGAPKQAHAHECSHAQMRARSGLPRFFNEANRTCLLFATLRR
eukprot:461546-Pleurochrysis_carterae.AAC.1